MDTQTTPQLEESAAPGAVERNLVYGMYSGMALLLDAYRPQRPNGFGVVLINGSGWRAPLGLDAEQLKDSEQTGMYAPPLTNAGYTVFAINHRSSPRFRHPAAIEDAHRAVRWVRANAARYGIQSERVGAAGGSSGGHLVSLLGLLDGAGDSDDIDPIGRLSGSVQCVVARAAPIDLVNAMSPAEGGGALAAYLGASMQRAAPGSPEYRLYEQASPIRYVSPTSPPFLLLHGDADDVVPVRNSELLYEALQRVGVAAKLIKIEGGRHGPGFPGAVDPPDYLGEMVGWFDRHLRDGSADPGAATSLHRSMAPAPA